MSLRRRLFILKLLRDSVTAQVKRERYLRDPTTEDNFKVLRRVGSLNDLHGMQNILLIGRYVNETSASYIDTCHALGVKVVQIKATPIAKPLLE